MLIVHFFQTKIPATMTSESTMNEVTDKKENPRDAESCNKNEIPIKKEQTNDTENNDEKIVEKEKQNKTENDNKVHIKKEEVDASDLENNIKVCIKTENLGQIDKDEDEELSSLPISWGMDSDQGELF